MSAAGVTLVLSGGGARTAAHVGALMANATAAQLAPWRADPGRPALVYVRPRVERSATFRVDRVRRYADDGYRAAREALAAAGRP